MKHALTALALACLAGVGGCSGSGGGAPTSGAVGGFGILLSAPVPASMGMEARPGQTRVLGAVSAGPTPDSVSWRQTAEQGGCRLLQPMAHFCDPQCDSLSVCGAGGRCAPYPAGLNAGPVRVKGLRGASGPVDFTMQPLAPAFSYEPPNDLVLAYPPFAPGGDVELSAGGGAVAAFTLKARGISPLEVMGADPLPIDPARPLELRWRTPTAAETTTVRVSLDLTLHGGAKGKIECDGADNGMRSIPAPLVMQLIALGTAGFPAVTLRRVATGMTTLSPPGQADLTIVSEVVRSVQVPGDTSCLDDSMCPAGKTCKPNALCG